MTRIPLVRLEEMPDAVRDFVQRRGALAVYRLVANAPAVFVGWTKMVEAVLDSPTFSARMRELVALRVAYLQGSSYEMGHHLDRSRQAKISQDQLDALTSHGDLTTAGFDVNELAVLQFVTELCTTKHVCDDTFATTRAALGDEALTELLILVSLYYGLALVLNATELELDENVPT